MTMLDAGIIDTHAHLDMPQFDADREQVVARAQAAGVSLVNTIGTDVDSSRKAIGLADKYAGVVASVGIHPQEADRTVRDDIERLAEMAQNPRVVAVGEMGLDYYRDEPSRPAQLRVLEWELDLATRVELPVIIHCRQAQETLRPVIESWTKSHPAPAGKPRGVLHCFSGDLETAQWYIERGFLISIGAYAGYPSSGRLRETLRDVPVEHLVVETDCPFLPPQKYRGKRNEPSFTLITVGVLAEIKKTDCEEMAWQTSQNALRLFRRILKNG